MATPVTFWEPLPVRRGSLLALGRISGAGQRSYLAVRGGFDIPEYLGSRATFTLGQFGGHGGRALRAGDVLPLARSGLALDGCRAIPHRRSVPQYGHEWQIGVTGRSARRAGFLHADDIRTFFDAEWEVHYNSSRTGVRLIGPKPHMGAHRWRRGGTPSVQHPRQRLRHRQHRLHRRHARDPRARWSEPRGIRLSRDHCR